MLGLCLVLGEKSLPLSFGKIKNIFDTIYLKVVTVKAVDGDRGVNNKIIYNLSGNNQDTHLIYQNILMYL